MTNISITNHAGSAETIATRLSGSDHVPLHQQLPPTTGTLSSVASSATDVLVLAANANRLGATIFNSSTQILYLVLGTTTSSTTVYSVQIAVSGYYEVPYGFTGQIRGIWASANGSAKITELT